MSASVADIMCREVITVGPLESVARAEGLMRAHRIGGLPVLEDGRLVGIITSRDVRASHPNRLVTDAMTRNPVVVSPQLSLWEAKEVLEKNRIERLPVVEGGRLVGIVTKAALYAELGKYWDALTGLSKSEYLLERARCFLLQGREIAVLFFDLDDFGRVNKLYGHAVGDEVIRQTGGLLQALMPPEAGLCRYGGDEFAAVLGATLDQARELGLRAVARVEEAEWPLGIRISLSVGIVGGRRAAARPDGNWRFGVKELLNLASLACTRAKRQKSRIAVADTLQLVRG
ncbi:MAG: CBS domain-containing protein [Clostridia bacterium]|jgi:diguanylate cyclase (GGDEF)-like protein|nr:CBS domain-containing protein [Clostridia bacterium]MDH7572730.1 CBS domain-containing protein [Clostridia bacterium]